MLPEFEAAARGMAAGEEKSFELMFPPPTTGKEVAGKKASFAMTLRKIEQPRVPEVDAEFAKRSAWPTATRPRCGPKCAPTSSAR